MSNSEFLSQFKEEFQKLKQQRIEIDQNSRKILLQKMEDSKITIQVLKASGFTFQHPDNKNIKTKHGAIVGCDEQYLYVYCGEDTPQLCLVDRADGNIIKLEKSLINLFVKSDLFDIVFAVHGLNSLEQQATDFLKSYKQDIEERQKLNSNFLS